jgi:hypothetical protein
LVNRSGAGAQTNLGTNLSIGSTLSISAGIFNAGTNTLNGTGGLTMTNGELRLSKNTATLPELTGTYSLTGGTVSFDGNGTGVNAQTIRAVNYWNLTSTSTGDRSFANAGTVGIAGVFTKGSNTYSFTGSTINYNGNVNQDIVPFTASTSVQGATYNNLTLSNTGTKQLTAITDVEGELMLSGTTTLRLNNNNLLLKSVQARTANVGQLDPNSSIDYNGTGRFVVERFMPARRAWRLMAAPINSNGIPTISQAWQEGLVSANRYAPVIGTSGYGTAITNGTVAANGFDQGSTANPSIRYFSGGSWLTPTSTTIPVNTHPGYMLFVRGDRSIIIENQWVAANITTLRPTGRINTGTQDVINGSGFAVVDNPFASAINFNQITRGGTLGNSYYLWDPRLGGAFGQGGFVSFLRVGGIYQQTVTATGSGYGGSLPNDGTIESGAAFMVDFGTSGSLQIAEDDKLATSDYRAFGRPGDHATETLPIIRTNLMGFAADSSTFGIDGTLHIFGDEFSNEADLNDARKVNGYFENISLKNVDKLLAIETRKPFNIDDTLQFNIASMRVRRYQLMIECKHVDDRNLAAYLLDRYLNTYTALQMTGITTYNFSVENIPAAYDAKRFAIVFRKPVVLTLTSAKAGVEGVKVAWNAANENDIVKYTIERAKEDMRFIPVTQVVSASNGFGTNLYEGLDEQQPNPGIYYYRIKATSIGGVQLHSNVEKVTIMNTGNEMYLFPNPVTNGQMGLQIHNNEAGQYQLRMFNSAGQLLFYQQLQYNGGSQSNQIKLSNTVPGKYLLEVIKPNKQKLLLPVLIQ